VDHEDPSDRTVAWVPSRRMASDLEARLGRATRPSSSIRSNSWPRSTASARPNSVAARQAHLGLLADPGLANRSSFSARSGRAIRPHFSARLGPATHSSSSSHSSPSARLGPATRPSLSAHSVADLGPAEHPGRLDRLDRLDLLDPPDRRERAVGIRSSAA